CTRPACCAITSSSTWALEKKGARNMNSKPARIFDDPAATAELVAPLSGPSYGAYSVARRRWRKPLPAIIADAIANCDAVSARLNRGMYAPDREGEAHYRGI